MYVFLYRLLFLLFFRYNFSNIASGFWIFCSKHCCSNMLFYNSIWIYATFSKNYLINILVSFVLPMGAFSGFISISRIAEVGSIRYVSFRCTNWWLRNVSMKNGNKFWPCKNFDWGSYAISPCLKDFWENCSKLFECVLFSLRKIDRIYLWHDIEPNLLCCTTYGISNTFWARAIGKIIKYVFFMETNHKLAVLTLL